MARPMKEVSAGTKFGEWTVISEGSNEKRRSMLCRCSCGVEQEVDLSNLIRGGSKMCFTCSRRLTPRGGKPKIQVTSGDVYGDWTVLEEVERKDKKRYVKCRCSCGAEKDLPLNSVYAGLTKSCNDCRLAKAKLPRKVISAQPEIKQEKTKKQRTLKAVPVGTKFGLWEIVKEIDRILPAPRRFLCRCVCGTEKERDLSNLKLDRTSNCGCQTRRGPKPEIRVKSGDTFGKWTVKEKSSGWSGVYLCTCICGRERRVARANLVTGKSTQCLPCSKGRSVPSDEEKATQVAPRTGREVVINIEVGAVYGGWTVIIEDVDLNGKDADERYFKCRCACGVEKSVQMRNLIRGRSRSCNGCAKKLFFGMKSEVTGNELLHSKWEIVERHAQERGLVVEITPEYAWSVFLAQGEKCALTGLPLTLGVKNSSSNASLDRIDNRKGYVISNIQWLKGEVNQMKNKHDQAYFLDLCELITKHKRK